MKIVEFYGKGWMRFACVLERSQWKMFFEDANSFSSQIVTGESFDFFLLFSCVFLSPVSFYFFLETDLTIELP